MPPPSTHFGETRPSLPLDLVLGDARLDAHHAILFGLLDSAAANPSADPTLSSIELAALVKALLLYARQHFDLEELAMAADGWPGLPDHRLMHQEFQRRCEELITLGHSGHKTKSSEWRIPVGGLTGGLTAARITDTLRGYLRDQIANSTVGDAAYVNWRKAKPR